MLLQADPAKPKISDWKEFTAPDGRKYYYNSTTKVSSWTMPEELKKGSETPSAAKASPAPDVQVWPWSAPRAQLAKLCRACRDTGVNLPAASGWLKTGPVLQELVLHLSWACSF